MPEIGQTISHYRIIEKLGAGGMGVIYKAEDTRLGRFVALKFLAERFSQDRDALERFQREARAASALNHPNIVHIYDITADQGVDFIAMEYVEGKTLEQQIGRRSLRLNDVLKYAVQVADALAKAHAAGLGLMDLDWSPRSGWLLGETRLENGAWAIWAFREDGSGGHKVLMDERHRIGSPRWSATGDAIYYFRQKGNLSDLMKLSIDSGSGEAKDEPSVISSDMEVNGYYLSQSGDGSHLVYARSQQSSNLWLAEISGSEKQKQLETKPLTKGTLSIQSTSISPDGKWVAFVTSPPGANIYKMPIDGGQHSQLTFSAANHRGVVWSPNGKRIAFVSDESGSAKIWIEDADGGTPRRLAKTQPIISYPIGWAPGLKILYRAGTLTHKDLRILDPDTAEEKSLTPSSSAGSFVSFQSSPDGNKIAVHSDSGLWVISLKDKSEVLLTKDKLSPCGWSPDGGLVYAYKGDAANEGALLAVPAAGGNPRPIVTLPKGIYPESMSPDGRKFVYTVSETKSDVWLMENFDPARRK